MRTRLLLFMALAAMMLIFAARPGLARQSRGDLKEGEAIKKNAEAFVEAFHKGDAKAVAAFWTPDGDYTDQTGHHLKGREAIEKSFTEFFSENKGLKLRINSLSFRFVTPDVAIEDGTSEVIPADGGPPSRARYTNVHVKTDGKWLLSSVREAAYAPPSNNEHLRGLEWVLGDWADESENGEAARLTFSWSENQAFLVSSYATTFKNITLAGGTQWIGWDPIAKSIRSWSFETNGGFGEGSWTRDGHNLVIKTTAVLPDGKKVTGTTTVTPVDADNITWQSKDRAVDGKSLPDSKVVKLKRVK